MIPWGRWAEPVWAWTWAEAIEAANADARADGVRRRVRSRAGMWRIDPV